MLAWLWMLSRADAGVEEFGGQWVLDPQASDRPEDVLRSPEGGPERGGGCSVAVGGGG